MLTKEKVLEIHKQNLLRVIRLEEYLQENLENKFVGIESLSEKFNVSPSKLKKDFKQLYGKPIFQYYQQKQMDLAKRMLTDEDARVKELADKFGYENVGKFSQVFQKHFRILPSALQKTG
jgi:AraC-like DNA-binding protein